MRKGLDDAIILAAIEALPASSGRPCGRGSAGGVTFSPIAAASLSRG